MKLISTTDFVLTQFKKWENDNNPDCQSSGRYILGTKIYATFLKQPLRIGMFIPCDKNGTILKEPNHFRKFIDKSYLLNKPKMSSKWIQECEEYQAASNEVFFKNFELVTETEQTWVFKIQGEFPRLISKNGLVEWLIPYNNIYLTNNIIKKLNL